MTYSQQRPHGHTHWLSCTLAHTWDLRVCVCVVFICSGFNWSSSSSDWKSNLVWIQSDGGFHTFLPQQNNSRHDVVPVATSLSVKVIQSEWDPGVRGVGVKHIGVKVSVGENENKDRHLYVKIFIVWASAVWFGRQLWESRQQWRNSNGFSICWVYAGLNLERW